MTSSTFLRKSLISLLGCSQVGKATGFGPVIRGFESFRPSHSNSAFPSSSRPRTTAFHAVDRGSNPLGNASQLEHSLQSGCFFCGQKSASPLLSPAIAPIASHCQTPATHVYNGHASTHHPPASHKCSHTTYLKRHILGERYPTHAATGHGPRRGLPLR